VRLAYKPDKPVNIIELPPDLYAVQIVAMSSRDALEDFVSDNRLRGMSAARVANDGQVFYVLLLGIYETAAIANEAIEDIPPPMDKLSPWVRRLGSLQHAMIRADEITDNSSL
jgi:septal ring-binding cell division protein DamX